MLISVLVKQYIPSILEYCSNQDPNELDRLMDKQYSNDNFKLSFPFCKEYLSFNERDYTRFYKKDYPVQGKEVRVCSQWIIGHKVPFLNYLLKKNLIDEGQFNEFMQIVQKKSIRVIDNVNYESPIESQRISKEYVSIRSDSFLINNYRAKILGRFDLCVKQEANSMSKYYEIFYGLERTIRDFVARIMEAKYGSNWWDYRVDNRIQESVGRKIKDEEETLFTKQSERPIDYATFSELGFIMTYNWSLFKDNFAKDQKVLIRIMHDLNKLRIPIAHCNPFNEKEKDLFYLTIGYWFDILKK